MSPSQTRDCPVCNREFSSFLNLARHMVLSDRPDGSHIEWLEDFLGAPFQAFGWGKDRAIANRLGRHWQRNRSW